MDQPDENAGVLHRGFPPLADVDNAKKKDKKDSLVPQPSLTTSTASQDQNAAQKVLSSAQKQWEKEKKQFQQDISRGSKIQKRLHRQLVEASSKESCAAISLEDLQQKHQVELDELNKDVYTLQDKIKLLHVRLERQPLLEQNLVDLLMEFREPKQDDLKQRVDEFQKQLQSERQALSALSPLVVLEQLRQNIRRVNTQHLKEVAQLKQQLQTNTNDIEKLTQTADGQAYSFQLFKQHTSEIQNKLNNQVEDLKEKLLNTIQSHEQAVHALKTENALLQKTVQSREREIQKLQECVERRDGILLAKEAKFVKISELQQELENVKARHELQVSNLRRENANHQQELKNVQSVVIHKIRIENNKLQNEVHALKRNLLNTTVAMNRSKVVEMETTVQKLHDGKQKSDDELKALQLELTALRKGNEEYKAKNELMREEYTKLYNVAQKVMDKKSSDESKLLFEIAKDKTNDNEVALTNRLEEKEKECRELQRRLKKLILQQHRDMKYHELERGNLLEELQCAQLVNEELGGPPPKVLPQRNQLKLIHKSHIEKLRPKSAAASYSK